MPSARGNRGRGSAQRIGRGLARALSQGRLGEACRQDQERGKLCTRLDTVCGKEYVGGHISTQGDGAAPPAEPQRAPPMFRLPFRRAPPDLALSAAVAPLSAQDTNFVAKQHYIKRDMIPMRDGVRLFTIVYEPRDTANLPILLVRTPYSIRPYEPDEYRRVLGPSQEFDKDGYIFRLPGRAWKVPIRRRVRSCGHSSRRSGRRRMDRAATRTTRSSGC